MARLFVQLKLRLLLNALRSSNAAEISFIVSTFFAVVLAAGGFLLLSLLRNTSNSVDLTTIVFTAFALGWLILPIFAFGLDSTLDPAALALYPLRMRPLATGLLAASATGAWPVANVIALLGVTVGLARGAAGIVIAVVAVLMQVLFCMVLARFVTTGMAGLLRSRRGRDLAALLVIPIFAFYEIFIQVVPKVAASGQLSASSFTSVASWLRWLPPGLAAHAIQDASDGRPGTALLLLALLAAVIAAFGWLWVRSLGNALVTADSSTQASRARGGVLPLGRLGLRGTVAARFWIYQRRDPLSLVYWAMTAVIMVTVSISTIVGQHQHPAVVLGSAVLGAGFVGAFHANPVGFTGQPFVVEAQALTSNRELRAYFSGQNIVLCVIAVPLLTAISFGLAAGVGRPAEGVAAAAIGLATLGAALGMSNIFAVVLPYPMDKRAGSPLRQAAQGYGAYGFGSVFGTLAGAAVAAIPVIVASLLTNSDPAAIRAPVLLACAAIYGLALAWAGVRIAARAAEQKLPDLCQVAASSKA